jgi:Tol biopolymer transport system component
VWPFGGRPEGVYVYWQSGELDRVIASGGGDNWNAVWSPDGSQIAWHRTPGRNSVSGQIWVARADGSEARAFATGSAYQGLEWTPDGSRLLYQSGGEIRLLDPVSGAIITVAPGSYPRLSPDGPADRLPPRP